MQLDLVLYSLSVACCMSCSYTCLGLIGRIKVQYKEKPTTLTTTRQLQQLPSSNVIYDDIVSYQKQTRDLIFHSLMSSQMLLNEI